MTTIDLRTRIAISATLDTLVTNSTTLRTITRYKDTNHSVLADAPITTAASQLSTRVPIRTLQLLHPASGTVSVSMREAFNVTLSLLTETGLPVVGQPVHAYLLDRTHGHGAPRTNGSATNASLMSGSTIAFTDEDGMATLSIRFRTGASSNYTLIFSSTAAFDLLNSPAGLVVSTAQRLANALEYARAAISDTMQLQRHLQQFVRAMGVTSLKISLHELSARLASCPLLNESAAAAACVAEALNAVETNSGGSIGQVSSKTRNPLPCDNHHILR